MPISINEPTVSRGVMLTPQSANEPTGADDLHPPRVTGIDPASCTVGDPAFTMTVTGTDFPTAAVVTIGGVAMPTVFVSETELAAEVDPAGSAAGGYPVTIAVGELEVHPAVMFTVYAAEGAADDSDPLPSDAELMAMTRTQLDSLAADRGIDSYDAPNKAAVIQMLKDAG